MELLVSKGTFKVVEVAPIPGESGKNRQQIAAADLISSSIGVVEAALPRSREAGRQ